MKKILSILTLLFPLVCAAQPTLVDEIVAVVGDEIILYSDVQIHKNQLKAQGYALDVDDCQVLEEILFEKLMLNQAKVDSLEVTDDMVNAELEKRISVFIQQIGSPEKLEAYYGKSMSEIREEFFDVLKDQILVQRMEGEISNKVNITPIDVEEFYNAIHPDSLPFISASVEMAQIVKYPVVSTTETERVRERLRMFREGVVSGNEDFETLAALYSEDPGSASKGGNLGMQPRGTFVPEFDAVAFNLEDGEISAPFKTPFGFHIMQMIERRGEMYNANHILLIPKVTSDELNTARRELEEVRQKVMADSISFAFAASRYSDHERTKNQNGMMVNQATGSTVFDMEELEPPVFLTIDSLEVGDVSQTVYFQERGSEKGYRIVKLINRTEPHRANMRDDYQSLQNMATEKLRAKTMDTWVRKRISETFIKVNDSLQGCEFKYPWKKEGIDQAKAN